MVLLSKPQIWLYLVTMSCSGVNVNHLCPVHLLTDWSGSLSLKFVFSTLNPTGFVYLRLSISLRRCLPVLRMLTGNAFLWRMVFSPVIFSLWFMCSYVFYDLVFTWWLFFTCENLEIILILWKLRSFFPVHSQLYNKDLPAELPRRYLCFILFYQLQIHTNYSSNRYL